MTTSYTEVQLLDAVNNNEYIDSIIMKVDTNGNILEAYLASDSTNTNILIPTSAGTYTGFKSNDNDGNPIDLYDNPGISWTSYDNVYKPGWFNYDGGVLVSTLGPSIDARMIQLLRDTAGPYTNEHVDVGDELQYNLGLYYFSDQTSSARIFENTGNMGMTTSLPINYNFIDNISCFCKDTQILCADGTTTSIQYLTPGTLVQTLTQGPKRIITIGERTIPYFNRVDKVEDRIYTYGDSELMITGKHCVLVDTLTELQIKQITYLFKSVKMIEGKYMLPVWLDMNAKKIINKTHVSLYHIVLESEDENKAFGVCANGIWVESCSEYDFKTYSGMTPINV